MLKRGRSYFMLATHWYGKVFKSNIFGNPTIISADAELTKLVLQSDTTTFVSSFLGTTRTVLGDSSLVFMTGSRQRRFHGLVAQFYNSPHLKAQVTRDMQKYLEDRMSRWKDDQLIHIQEESNNIAVPILVKAILQVKEGKEMQLLKQHIKVFMAGLFCLPLDFPGTQLYKALQAKKSMTKLIRKIMEERKKTGHNPSVPKDVLDVLLNDATEQFCFDEISIHVIKVIGAGDENTTSLLTLVVKYLSDCPRALQQLTEENIELKKEKAQLGQSLCWNDYMSLSFTQDVITETLRKATKDIDVNGYHILEGWCVFTNFPSIHLDQIAYSSP